MGLVDILLEVAIKVLKERKQKQKSKKKKASKKKLVTKNKTAKKEKPKKAAKKKTVKKAPDNKPVAKKAVKKKVGAKKKAVKKPATKKKAAKKVVKKAEKKKAVKPVKEANEIEIGYVTNYFSQVKAAAIFLEKKGLKVGDEICIVWGDDKVHQKLSSMQIDREPVEVAKKGQEIGVKLKEPVKAGNPVYLVKK